MKTKRKVLVLLVVAICICAPFSTFAHSGGTDSYGGHHDYKNASGLGSYHYHHGNGPHLHPGGICPYATNSSGDSTLYYSEIAEESTLLRPTFPVYINNYNINNTTSIYYPTAMNNIVYVPLSAEMISVMKLRGGWNAINGMILTSSEDVYSSSSFGTASSATTTTTSIEKPSFAVIVNNNNLNVTDSQYYPVVMNYVVYIPLSSENLSAMRLSGGWNGSFMSLNSY